jgi:MFS family permease
MSMAVVADIATSAERGRYMGYALSGLLLGPAFGPLLGGTLAQYLGWRSIFWFLAIFGASFLILFTSFFPETCRRVVGNGSIPAKGISLSFLGYIRQRNRRSRRNPPSLPSEPSPETPSTQTTPPTRRTPNPLAVLRILTDKESCLLLTYNALVFSGQMVVAASLPIMLAQTYALNTFKVGLCFLPLGLGALIASITIGYIVDWNFGRHAAKAGLKIRPGQQQDLRDFPLERARCEVALPNHVVGMLGMIAFGWVMEYRVSLAWPEVVLFVLGFSLMGAFSVSNAFIVDLHRELPATATAAVNLTRCLVSAGGVAVIVPMIDAWGRGWSFTFIGLVDLALLPVLWILVKFGPRWRVARLEKERKKEAERRDQSRQQDTHNQNVRQSIESREKDLDV